MRVAAFTLVAAAAAAALPVGTVFAQESAPVSLEQARSGEDGIAGSGATSGGLTTGNAERDRNGNAGTASAGTAGEAGTGETTSEETLPANADLLAALGILDDVTRYDVDVLANLTIPVELLPPPPAEPVSSVPPDINTGGQGDSSTVSTEPGSGAAPAGGSVSSASEDGVGSSSNGDRPRRNRDDGTTDTASGS